MDNYESFACLLICVNQTTCEESSREQGFAGSSASREDSRQGQPQKAGLYARPGGPGHGPTQPRALQASGPARVPFPLLKPLPALQEMGHGDYSLLCCLLVSYVESCGEQDTFAALGMFTASSRSTDLSFPVAQNNFRTWLFEKILIRKLN